MTIFAIIIMTITGALLHDWYQCEHEKNFIMKDEYINCDTPPVPQEKPEAPDGKQ